MGRGLLLILIPHIPNISIFISSKNGQYHRNNYTAHLCQNLPCKNRGFDGLERHAIEEIGHDSWPHSCINPHDVLDSSNGDHQEYGQDNHGSNILPNIFGAFGARKFGAFDIAIDAR